MNCKRRVTATVISIGNSYFRGEGLSVRTSLSLCPIVKGVNERFNCIKSEHEDAPPTDRWFEFGEVKLIPGNLKEDDLDAANQVNEEKNKETARIVNETVGAETAIMKVAVATAEKRILEQSRR